MGVAGRGCRRQDARMRIFHIATLADWNEAQRSGTYTAPTYGRTPRQEGFVPAAYRDQVPGIRDGKYGDVAEPLVVLEIETDLLGTEVGEAHVGDQVFPRVRGPIPTRAVVDWRPARPSAFEAPPARGPASPFTRAFQGVGLVLSAATVVLFLAATVARSRVDDGRLSDDVAFLLWTLTVTALVSAVTAFAVSAVGDHRT
jgi:uncharacterized protein (DUF952 family)